MRDAPPSSWEEVSLGDLVTRLVNGGTPPTDVPSYWQGDTPWITGADFSSSGLTDFRRFVSDEAVRQTVTNVIAKGELLIVTRTGVGKLAIAPCDVAISQDITGLYPDRQRTTVEFLYHRMRKGLQDIRKLNQGTSINGIVRKDLVSYRIELPPLPQQQLIADILSNVDQAIEQTEARIAKAQQTKAGLMHDLFTRGVTADGQLRPPREDAPQLFKETLLGCIPKEWDLATLGSISELVTSGSRGWAAYYADEGAVFVRIGNLTREHPNLWLEDVVRVQPPTSAEGARTRLATDDVLISITADLGIVGVVPSGLGEAYINQHIALVRPQQSLAAGRWLGHWLGGAMAQARFRRLNDSGAKAGLNLPAIRAFPVVLPPRKERDQSVRVIDALDQCIHAEREAAAKLNCLKSGLMHDLLLGRVHVVSEMKPERKRGEASV